MHSERCISDSKHLEVEGEEKRIMRRVMVLKQGRRTINEVRERWQGVRERKFGKRKK